MREWPGFQAVPYPPVGHLILFVGIEINEPLEEICQAALREAEQFAGKEGVKKTVYVETQISL